MTSSLGRGRLLAVIPAYNEQGAIRRVAAGVREVLPEADVLVVDDGSSDRTTEEAEAGGALVVRHPFNLGIGATVQTGLRFACEEGYEIVFRLDGDGQHNPSDLPVLYAALRENRVRTPCLARVSWALTRRWRFRSTGAWVSIVFGPW